MFAYVCGCKDVFVFIYLSIYLSVLLGGGVLLFAQIATNRVDINLVFGM